MADGFDKSGGAARHPDAIAPPPPPKSQAVAGTPVKVPAYVHPANRKEGQA